MSITEKTTLLNKEGAVVDESERKLYTLAELKVLDDRPRPEQDDEVDHRAYQNALETLAQWEAETWDGLDELDNYLSPEVFDKAGITFNEKSATWNVGYGGTWFALPRETDIKVPEFLRAMKLYFSGHDIRGSWYDKQIEGRKIICSEREKHVIDLRSSDACKAREYGLVVHVFSSLYQGDSELELDGDYYLPEYSEGFKSDCNEFLKELCHYAAITLEEDYEDRQSEDSLLELAEMNEYHFDRNGKIA